MTRRYRPIISGNAIDADSVFSPKALRDGIGAELAFLPLMRWQACPSIGGRAQPLVGVSSHRRVSDHR
ncbi:MAG TPA: hypothetical protein K8U77_03985, partial [Slackia equolifaciens]|nr:hypothetical protein [Slackia equolifaciens]